MQVLIFLYSNGYLDSNANEISVWRQDLQKTNRARVNRAWTLTEKFPCTE